MPSNGATVEGTTIAAWGSLAGFVTSLVLYSYLPLPSSAIPWGTVGPWISVVLVVAGLVCFVVLLVTGSITLLNWLAEGSSRGTKRD